MKKQIQNKKNDLLLFGGYMILFLLIIYIIYILIRYIRTKTFSFELFTNYQSGMNRSEDVSSNLTQRSVQIENNFTNTTGCTEKDVQYCAKLGKNAVQNFNVNGGGCMCNEMESGV